MMRIIMFQKIISKKLEETKNVHVGQVKNLSIVMEMSKLYFFKSV